MATTPNQIHLSEDQKRQLALLADRTDKPWQQVLSEALTAYGSHVNMSGAPQRESYFDVATRLGLIACVEGGPADLSTNPDYMDGFGKSDS